MKDGISPVNPSPKSWIRHMAITLFISSSGNSERRKSAIRDIRRLCSATLSDLPFEVVQ